MQNPSEEKAELVLKMYKHEFDNIKKSSVSAQSYDGTITGSPKGNPTENSYVNDISAKTYCETVEATIGVMDNQLYAEYLKMIYIKNETITKTYRELHVARSTLYNWQPKAFMDFANFCPDFILEEATRLDKKAKVNI